MKEKKQLLKVKLLVSEEFENREISETFCADYSNLINKRFCLNLSELVETKKYQYKIWFKIIRVENGIAYSRFEGVETLREYIQDTIYPGIKVMRVYENFKTKDDATLRIKYVVIFRKIKGKKEKAVRKIIVETTKKLISEMTIKDLVKNMIIKNNVMKKIEKEIKKISIPIFFEIIKIERKDKVM